MTAKEASAIATETVGHDRYLNGCEGKWYWSAFDDDDERDGGPEGAQTYLTPIAALAALTINIGMVRWPVGWEMMPEDEAS
jgi:hypothetical protein